jgi:hypothetical protein
MRRMIQKQQRSLDNGNENKGWNQRHIGDGADVPGARRAIRMIAKGSVVLVMVNDAKHERHAQIQQTHQANHYTGFRHADHELGVSHRESQVWFGYPRLQEVVKGMNGLPTLRRQQDEEDHSRG